MIDNVWYIFTYCQGKIIIIIQAEYSVQETFL